MPKDETSDRRDMFSRHVLFTGLQPEQFEQIMSTATERRYVQGQTVFQRGDPGTSLIAVLDGQVRIGVCSEDGKEVTLGTVGRGELFGEIAVIDGQGRTADATAMTACRLLVLDRRDFLPFIERNPRFALQLLQILCARMRKSTNVCESLALLDVPVRLARLLLQLAAEHGSSADGSRRIGVRLSQQELGNLIAATRESVNKHLRAWEAEGLITVAQGYITLHDLNGLQLLSGSLT